jgi:Helix-turn-helix domain
MSDPSPNPAAVRLRALAHPLRWKLFDIVGREGTATATRCAELTGESVASCFYHLNVLGKYGYIEQVPGSGKEKPWRAIDMRQDLSAPGPELEDRLAAEAAAEAFVEHEFDRMRSWLRLWDSEPEEWQEATGLIGSTMWVTAAELREVHDEIWAILERYGERFKDPSLRPPDSRAARVFAYAAVSPRR